MKINYWVCQFSSYEEYWDGETESRAYGCTHPKNESCCCEIDNKYAKIKAECLFLSEPDNQKDVELDIANTFGTDTMTDWDREKMHEIQERIDTLRKVRENDLTPDNCAEAAALANEAQYFARKARACHDAQKTLQHIEEIDYE